MKIVLRNDGQEHEITKPDELPVHFKIPSWFNANKTTRIYATRRGETNRFTTDKEPGSKMSIGI